MNLTILYTLYDVVLYTLHVTRAAIGSQRYSKPVYSALVTVSYPESLLLESARHFLNCIMGICIFILVYEDKVYAVGFSLEYCSIAAAKHHDDDRRRR